MKLQPLFQLIKEKFHLKSQKKIKVWKTGSKFKQQSISGLHESSAAAGEHAELTFWNDDDAERKMKKEQFVLL